MSITTLHCLELNISHGIKLVIFISIHRLYLKHKNKVEYYLNRFIMNFH